MSEVLEFFLSNKNVIDALDNDYYYLVFKMAKQLEFREAQFRELVGILIDADIYPDKAEDDRIRYMLELFEIRLTRSTLPRDFDSFIKVTFSDNDKLGFNNETVAEIISEAFLNNRFKDYGLLNLDGEACIYQK